jgi:lipooligosaccharide transport system ATP-binding protein
MSAETVICAQGVAKRYGTFDALTALNLEVRRGECVGLLGPNGAGKSTFIGCLYGVVLRTGGRLEVFGHDPAREARAIKRRIGVVPQRNALDEGLTILEDMQIYARFGGLSRPEADGRIVDLLRHMALETKRDAPIKSCSSSMNPPLVSIRPCAICCGTKSPTCATAAKRCS